VLERDDPFIDLLIDSEWEFYTCLKTLTPPEQEMQCELWQIHAYRWKDIQRRKKTLSEEEKECRDTLIDLAEHKSAQGWGIRVTQYFRAGSIQYDSIPELQAIDLEQYRGPSVESWRISGLGDGN